jgi:hypothetical protein
MWKTWHAPHNSSSPVMLFLIPSMDARPELPIVTRIETAEFDSVSTTAPVARSDEILGMPRSAGKRRI